MNGGGTERRWGWESGGGGPTATLPLESKSAVRITEGGTYLGILGFREYFVSARNRSRRLPHGDLRSASRLPPIPSSFPPPPLLVYVGTLYIVYVCTLVYPYLVG